MRHHRRLSFVKKGEGEQLKHPLLPYPEKNSKMYIGKKYELCSEFMFCIPAKPISSVFGYDLDIFVRFTCLISIAIWLSILILEGVYFYTRGFGNQTYFIIIIAILVAISFIIFGIFCGIIGYIGCTISNARCIYSFFIQLSIQLLINVYALIASLVRGYLLYTCLYILFIASDIFFLFPAWSLYIHAKLNGAPPNISRHYGLFADILSKYEHKNENKMNSDEKDPLIEREFSSFSCKIDKNPNMNNKASLYYKERIRSHKTSDLSIKNDLEGSVSKKFHSILRVADKNDNLVSFSRISKDQEAEFKELGSNGTYNRLSCENNNNFVDSAANSTNTTRILLNWSKSSIQTEGNIMNFTNNSVGDAKIPINKIFLSEQNQPEYPRKDAYNGF